MNKATLCTFGLMLLMGSSALGLVQRDYSQRNVKVGEKFSIVFDSTAGTAVQWYVLEPLGPGIKFIEVIELEGMKAIKAQPGIPQPQLAGGPMVRTFVFQAEKPTDGTVYSIPFVKMDLSSKTHELKKVPYTVVPNN